VRLSIEGVCEQTATITSGVNMASELSFPVLNGICLGCARELHRLDSRTNTRVFGDDVIGKGPPLIDLRQEPDYPQDELPPNECLGFIRGQFGMRVKHSASGTQRNRLSVFTERFFDSRGNEYDGIKPHSFLKLFHASHPNRTLLTEDAHPEDFAELAEAVRRKFPSFLSSNRLLRPSGLSRSRIISTRHYVLKAFESVPRRGDNATKEHVDKTCRRIESYLFMVCPPTRGGPSMRIPSGLSQTYTVFQLDSVLKATES